MRNRPWQAIDDVAVSFFMRLTKPTGPVEQVPVDELMDPFGEWRDSEFVRIMRACQALAGTDCRFLVGGFGLDPWPVDVEVDLSTVMEDMVEVLAGVRAGAAAEIDFYEQGIERSLELTPVGDQVRIRCRSRTSWRPDPAVEYLDRAELIGMLTALCATFADAVAEVAPVLADLSPIAEWRHG